MFFSLLLVFLGSFFILKNQYMLPFKSNILRKIPYQFIFPYTHIIGLLVLFLSLYAIVMNENLILFFLLLVSGLNLSLFLFDYIIFSKNLEYSDYLKSKIIVLFEKSEFYLGLLNLFFGIITIAKLII